jgi:hypothetical protein
MLFLAMGLVSIVHREDAWKLVIIISSWGGPTCGAMFALVRKMRRIETGHPIASSVPEPLILKGHNIDAGNDTRTI